jgi:hypothetical protein
MLPEDEVPTAIAIGFVCAAFDPEKSNPFENRGETYGVGGGAAPFFSTRVREVSHFFCAPSW